MLIVRKIKRNIFIKVSNVARELKFWEQLNVQLSQSCKILHNLQDDSAYHLKIKNKILNALIVQPYSKFSSQLI